MKTYTVTFFGGGSLEPQWEFSSSHYDDQMALNYLTRVAQTSKAIRGMAPATMQVWCEARTESERLVAELDVDWTPKVTVTFQEMKEKGR